METGIFISRDSYAGKVWDILSQNRYTYAENNPVTFADPSGHAKSKSGAIASLMKKPITAVTNAGKSLVSSGLSGLRDNMNITNRGYVGSTNTGNKPFINTKIVSSNSNEWGYGTILHQNLESGITLSSWVENVAIVIEERKCSAYNKCINKIQETILNSSISVGAVPGEPLYVEKEGIKVQYGGNELYIPEKVQGTVLHNDTGEMETIIKYPMMRWGIVGRGAYGEGVQKDENSRYKIAVGPKILNPDYPDDGEILDTDYVKNQRIDLIIQNNSSGLTATIECVVVDEKAHTYNRYPDGHENSSLPYEVTYDVENGLVQTGISYPHSVNAGQSKAFAYDNMDGSVIEFAGHAIDFDIKNYKLVEVIVYD